MKNKHDNILLLSNRYDKMLLNSTIKKRSVVFLWFIPCLFIEQWVPTLKHIAIEKNTLNVFYGPAISYIDDNKCLNNHY